MPARLPTDRLTVPARRRGLRLACVNAGLWAIGNGLTSTTLIVYLALELGAAGVAVSLILAAPRLIGVSRMATPALVERLGDRRRFCVLAYLGSSLILLMLPVYSAPGAIGSPAASLTALVVLWSAYHLLEYCGTVALWSWLRDLAPLRIRGRFIGQRERWLNLGRIVGMTASGLFAFWWRETSATNLRWPGYAIPAAVGAVLMAAAVVPLARMPSLRLVRTQGQGASWAALVAPFVDRRFWPLLLYGVWFSTVNGVTQAAQGIFPARVLEFSLFWMLVFPAAMRFGQSVLSPHIGWVCDRYGNRPVMIVSQALVALGPLFYLLATPDARWWAAGAWLFWIAYVGINVALYNLILKLAPPAAAGSYIAAWFGVAGVFFGVSAIAGGALFNSLHGVTIPVFGGRFEFDRYEYLFLVGTVGRLLAIVLLWRLVEPGAWTWRKILRRPIKAASV